MNRNKVLIAVDGSEPCVRAAASLASLVRPEETDIHALVVLPYTVYPFVDDPDLRIEHERAAAEAATAASEKAVLTLEQAGHRVLVVRRYGYPTDEIKNEIDEWTPDLIVLGRRGLRGAKAWLGSVSEHVLHYASVPVLLVP